MVVLIKKSMFPEYIRTSNMDSKAIEMFLDEFKTNSEEKESSSVASTASLFESKLLQAAHIAINPHDFTYLIDPGEKICGDDQGKNVTLIAFVPVSANGFHNRYTVRATWANQNLFPSLRIVFMLGNSSDPNVNEKVRMESELYGDIVQEDYADTYRNLTIKTMAGIKWVSQHCSNAKFAIKVDDDVVVNTFFLLRFLDQLAAQSYSRVQNALLCYYFPSSVVDRYSESKFYVPYEDYADKYYNPYCSGPAYMFTPQLATKLYATSLQTKQFVFEDVYVGMLAKKLKASFVRLNSFYVFHKYFGYREVNKRSLDSFFFIYTDYHFNLLNIFNILLKRLYSSAFSIPM